MGMVVNERFVDAVRARFAPDTPLVLGCAAGVRSAHACEMLAAAGFTRLANMDGGFQGAPDGAGGVREPGWSMCGFEVTREASPEQTWAALERAAGS